MERKNGFTLIGTVTEAQRGHAHIMTHGGETATKKSAWYPESAKGFTLIELLVVIAIIALLSGVILASLTTARMKARDARRVSDFRQITIALELYFDSYGYYPGVDQNWAGRCTTPPCWDINGYNVSNNTGWTALASDLAPYLSKLPTDPINNGPGSDAGNDNLCTPWMQGCHVYAYGNVGRFGTNPTNSSPTKINTYDLVAQLEDDNNPAACKQQDYQFGFGSGGNGVYWCSHGQTYPTGILDPSPN